jgi:hypothetical protein
VLLIKLYDSCSWDACCCLVVTQSIRGGQHVASMNHKWILTACARSSSHPNTSEVMFGSAALPAVCRYDESPSNASPTIDDLDRVDGHLLHCTACSVVHTHLHCILSCDLLHLAEAGPARHNAFHMTFACSCCQMLSNTQLWPSGCCPLQVSI